ncbi:MAG: hypothetical protein ACE5OY_06210 [Candidatus Bathyarchaeia archaeon]
MGRIDRLLSSIAPDGEGFMVTRTRLGSVLSHVEVINDGGRQLAPIVSIRPIALLRGRRDGVGKKVERAQCPLAG